MDTWGLLWLIALIFILGIFPLYIIVKLLGGRVSILKALVIKIAAVVITLLLSMAFGLVGPLLVAICLIVLYMFAFRIGIIRAFLAWLLEGVVLAALIFALGATGIAAVKWNGIVAAFQHLASFI
ncbi:hypothetical protein KY359_01220 [Candidatus Woesearchaeota archaeon]|nr:hypothetical protein [Candidatus Woesearchaeota archaeon]